MIQNISSQTRMYQSRSTKCRILMCERSDYTFNSVEYLKKVNWTFAESQCGSGILGFDFQRGSSKYFDRMIQSIPSQTRMYLIKSIERGTLICI
jgi:hypothetical protein